MSNNSRLKYRPEIDGLRALSVVGVLLFHLKFHAFSGGFLGVDVFFVLSGYLITTLLLKELQNDKTISFINFYSRRIKRLLPAIISTVALTLAIWCIYFFNLDHETSQLLSSMRYGVVGFANIFFRKNIGNYFDASTDEMPLLHLWSLGVEEQFYIVWPLILIAVFKLSKKRFLRNLFVTFGVICIFSFADSLRHIYNGNQTRVFYSMLFRSWELGLGALVAIWMEAKGEIISTDNKVARNIWSTLGIGLVIFSIVYFVENNYFPGWRALFPTIGTALLIIGLNEKVWFYNIATFKPFVSIGKVSYGLYLYHWPLYAAAYLYAIDNVVTLSTKVYIVIASFILSYLSFYFWELPLHKSKFINKYSSKTIVVTGVSMIISMLGIFEIIERIHDHRLSKKPYKEYYSLLNERVPYPKGCYGSVTNFEYTNCLLHKSNSNSKNLVFMWGDSITWANANLLDPFISMNKRKDISVAALSNFGHPFVIPPFFNYANFLKEEAHKASAQVIDNTIKMQISKMVRENSKVSIIISAFWYGHLTNAIKDHPTQYIDLYKRHLDQTLKELKDLGVSKVLILKGYPHFTFNISQCTQVHEKGKCFFDRKKFVEQRNLISEILITSTAKFDFVKIVNVIDYICEQDKCLTEIPYENGLMPITWDSFHPTSEASRYLGKRIDGEINWLLEK
jgi:peptidoglycan/LPS O-acetylase OafA/YrhL